MLTCNKICARRTERRRHDLHRERIKNMKPQVNTSEPVVWGMEHVRNNLKREQMLEDRYSEIDHENRILLEKMSVIMREKANSLPPTARSKEMKGPVSLNRDYRKKELIRITKENQSILKRIQQAQPIYNHVQWEGDHRKQMGYLQNCCEYPLVLKSARGPTSELVPIGKEESGAAELEDAGAAPKFASTEPAQRQVEEDMRFVLKEGQRIGEKYYLVEMSTDNRTLVITAYDGDAEQTLELIVKEKDHRKIFRECNGDYGAIATKLKVEEDKLILDLIATEAAELAPPPAAAKVAERSPQRSKQASPPQLEDPLPQAGASAAVEQAPEAASPALDADLGADEMVVRHEKPGSVGSVNVELGLTDDLEARVRLRGLTPVTPGRSDSDWRPTTSEFYQG